MSVSFPNVRVGEPIRHEALSVFPLFSDTSGGAVPYVLADEALADESLIVEEVSESGAVSELLVENRGDVRVLFIEGEELIGAKQNRILNTSVLVAAGSKTKIPVSCVEAGRWRYKSRQFRSSGSHSPADVRYAVASSVGAAVKKRRGHTSDQGKIWNKIDALCAKLGVTSKTSAMSDAFESHEDQVSKYRKTAKYVDGATGVAFAVGERVVTVDLYDKPSTCQKLWDRLLSGVVLDAIRAGKTKQHAQVQDVEQLIGATCDAKWDEVNAAGEGEEYRAEFADDYASALTFEETVVHGSVVAGV